MHCTSSLYPWIELQTHWLLVLLLGYSCCALMILGVDLTLVDVLSRPFRNSPSGGTSQATGTTAVASLGEVAELMGYT